MMRPPRLVLVAALLLVTPALDGKAQIAADTAIDVLEVPRAHAGETPEIGDLLVLVDLGKSGRGAMSASPDRRYLALVQSKMQLATDTYVRELVLIDVATGQARVVADAGGFVLNDENGVHAGNEIDRHPVWSADSRTVAFLIGRDGEAKLGLYEIATGSVREAGEDLNIAHIGWSADGTAIIAEAIPTRQDREERAERDRANGFAVDDEYAPLYAALPVFRAEHERTSWRIDRVTGQATPASRTDTLASPPTGSIAWAAPIDPESEAERAPLQVHAHDQGGADVLCPAPECRGEIGPVWALPDASHIVFQRREGASREVFAFYEWRTRSGAVRLIHRGEEQDLDCTLIQRALYCLQETTTTPRRVVRIDTVSGDVATVFDPNPQWHAFRLPRIVRLDARDPYGEATFAHLVFPADYDRRRAYPLVIVQYRSRGFLRGGVGDEYPIWPLAARGYFVLSVDRPEPLALQARLPANEVVRRTALDNSENLMKHAGLERLLDQALQLASIDQRRIAITGLSDGAETVFYEIAHSSRYSLAVSSSAPTDPIDWWLNAQTLRRSARQDLGLDWPDPRAEGPWAGWWRTNNTAAFAQDIQAPLLMQLSDSEALSAFPLYARLKGLERPVDLYLYPGEYHLKWRPRHIALAQIRALDWIDFWFRGIERGDPVDSQRLERWRSLRPLWRDPMRQEDVSRHD